MDKRRLGQTDLWLSPLGLGTVKFGRNEQVKYPAGFKIPEEPELAGLLARAKELGVNVLDTAPSYGLSEERLGRLLKGQRPDWIIIGKAGEDFENGQSRHDFTPEHFEFSLLRSLKRLNTDYIDIFLIHSDGADIKILSDDKLIKKLLDFKKRGLVRALGASTKTPEGGLKVLELFDTAMITYNALHTSEKPVLNKAEEISKGILLKKSLQSGHVTSVQEAMDFALTHRSVTSIIAGTINPAHLAENVKAVISSCANLSRESG